VATGVSVARNEARSVAVGVAVVTALVVVAAGVVDAAESMVVRGGADVSVAAGVVVDVSFQFAAQAARPNATASASASLRRDRAVTGGRE